MTTHDRDAATRACHPRLTIFGPRLLRLWREKLVGGRGADGCQDYEIPCSHTSNATRPLFSAIMAFLHSNRTFMTLSPDALRMYAYTLISFLLADMSSSFTKALFCLSKYGGELSLQATNDTLSLSATNSAKSAYCRLKYDKQFFSRYNIARSPDQPLDYEPEVLGQLTARVRGPHTSYLPY